MLSLAGIKISFPLLPIASLRLCHSAIGGDVIVSILVSALRYGWSNFSRHT